MQKAGEGELFKKNIPPHPAVLDLLHAHRVSQLNILFKFAQSVRYPEFTTFIPSANPLTATFSRISGEGKAEDCRVDFSVPNTNKSFPNGEG